MSSPSNSGRSRRDHNRGQSEGGAGVIQPLLRPFFIPFRMCSYARAGGCETVIFCWRSAGALRERQRWCDCMGLPGYHEVASAAPFLCFSFIFQFQFCVSIFRFFCFGFSIPFRFCQRPGYRATRPLPAFFSHERPHVSTTAPASQDGAGGNGAVITCRNLIILQQAKSKEQNFSRK